MHKQECKVLKNDISSDTNCIFFGMRVRVKQPGFGGGWS